MIYVVIDTNVLVSALLTRNEDAATVKVLGLVFSGEITPLYSNETMKEYKEVLSRQKFGFSPDIINYVISAIGRFGIQVEPTSKGVTLIDMDDLPFYEIVLEKQDEPAFLVTGDIKHFTKEPFIVTPSEFLNIIKNLK